MEEFTIAFDEDKRKLTYNEMINHMKSKGITFNHMSEEAAKKVLKGNTYYYKVTSFRQNFRKVKNKYSGLDFDCLADLGSIDMQLRYFILEMALDYEHSIKTKILDLISSDPSEDGYSIVDEFKTAHPATYKIVLDNLKKNKYLKDMYAKRHTNPGIWVILEIMTFGSLSIFIDFYYSRKKTKSLKPAYNLTKYAKNIRNAAAHNNPILLNFYETHSLISIDQAVVSYASIMDISNTDIRDRKINDLVSLFYLHSTYCSLGITTHKKIQGQRLIDRSKRKSHYYADINNLQKFATIFGKCIDYMNEMP